MDEQLIQMLSSPILISILLVIGVQAILIEISNPGGWVVGFIGALFLATALYGMTLISVNWLGLGLVAIAFVFFMLEAKTPSFGGMSIIGILMMMAGLWVAFNLTDSSEAVALTLPAAFLISLISGGVFVFVAGKALQAQGAATHTGVEGLLNQHGVVRKSIKAKMDGAPYRGMVFAAGELWQAEADEPIGEDADVVITAVNGLSLHVKKAGESA